MHYLHVTKYRRHGRSWKSLYRQAEIAQLGERQTEDLKVPGSIPGLGTFEQQFEIAVRRVSRVLGTLERGIAF